MLLPSTRRILLVRLGRPSRQRKRISGQPPVSHISSTSYVKRERESYVWSEPGGSQIANLAFLVETSRLWKTESARTREMARWTTLSPVLGLRQCWESLETLGLHLGYVGNSVLRLFAAFRLHTYCVGIVYAAVFGAFIADFRRIWGFAVGRAEDEEKSRIEL
ncbi:hypothetical protein K505DRAFT_152385 [Melanomma pulvis-pyrius CBS 109.77]|uniref:Uncharacterized protein n=1 Tax=Melanomma pulvis-pyrius CBS 109.77 TaxID=1314802 RepID=A0A6A6XYB4_9PLEO|nr:hypothetical protein K505DRAFT_152385 [Melanomma pulvis-pyrius CBS 109.77]